MQMMATFDEGILNASKPEKCGCQELLNKITLVHHGWLRRKGLRNALQIKYIRWPQQYVIIGEKCLYYYSSETSKQPDGAVSLYGFNKIVRASDVKNSEALWAFKLEHIQPCVKSLYFAASSEREMLTWMKAIKAEMLNANSMKSKFDIQALSLENSSQGSWDSGDYRDLEESIYMEAIGSRTSGYSSDKDDETVEDFEHPPLPPRLPRHSNSAFLAKSQTLPDRDEKRASSHFSYSLQINVSSDDSDKSWHKDKRLKPPLSPQSKETITDPSQYWASVYFNGSKIKAAEVMSKIADDGTYLIRKSDDNTNVLLFYAHPVIKKFKIIEKINGCVALSSQEPEFETVEDMLYHYYSNNMPNTNMKLTTPYSLHSRYQE
ncbi:hypothetical protein BsWGS_05197 [Bradybaena similaris]